MGPTTLETKCTKIKDSLRFSEFERNSMLAHIFGKLTLLERAYISTSYKDKYNISLQKELREMLGESPFCHLISLLCIPIEDAEITIITRILDGENGLSSKKKDEELSRIICGRQHEEIQTLK